MIERICRYCGQPENQCLIYTGCSLNKGNNHAIAWYVGKDELMCNPKKSYSEEMEEQLEPRPTADKLDLVNNPPRPWDHSDRHENVHEHTQD